MRFTKDEGEKGNQSNHIKLGLRPNIQQFLILVLVNAFVGGMIGLEQTVVPLIGKTDFSIESSAIIVSFIASFGAVKAILNLVAGNLSDKWGRKNVLVLGWIFGIPVPIILLLAPNWNWIIFANILLGINQGLTWSMTVNMKIDLVGKLQRGLALGLNEFAGYLSVASIGFLTGYLASIFGLKPYPFYIGIIFAILGFAVSWIIVKDTRRFTALELMGNASELPEQGTNVNDFSFKEVFVQTSWKDRTLLSISQAGLVNNLIFGVTWGIFTLYFASFAIGITEIGFLKALHPAIWGILQLLTGTLSDKAGRKILIYPGMLIQGIGVWVVLFSNFYLGWIAGMSLIGIGTALVYPTLLAAISDVANPKWRATSLGVYRFWRDIGFVFGAVGIGFLADLFGLNIAIHLVAFLAIASGVFVLAFMNETNRGNLKDN